MTHRQKLDNISTENFLKMVGGEGFEFCSMCKYQNSELCGDYKCTRGIDEWLDEEESTQNG